LPPVVRGQVELVLANHALLTTQIQPLDRYIKATVQRDATARRLQTIPGIGPFGALLLQAEIGPIARFGSAHDLEGVMR
jgi:transposase